MRGLGFRVSMGPSPKPFFLLPAHQKRSAGSAMAQPVLWLVKVENRGLNNWNMVLGRIIR